MIHEAPEYQEDMKPTIHFMDEYAKKFIGFDPGDKIVLRIEATLTNIGLESADLRVDHCELEDGEPRDYNEAARRARNEVYTKSSVEPSIG